MKISIITINRNNAEGLRKTMQSVFSQSYHDFEYIVIDGASTDNSVDTIRDFEKFQDLSSISFKWQSEPDTGIYNAMNKGVRMSEGEYVLMLNSADVFCNDKVIEKIIPLLDVDIVQGNIIEEREGKWWRNRGYAKSDISFLDVQRGYFLHQAAFCKKSLFDKFGYFREDYRYVSDTIFFIKALGYGGASFKYVDIDIADFDTNGFSSSTDPKISFAYKEEEERMQTELFPGRLYAYCRDSERKVVLYEMLKKHNWAWKLTMCMKRICSMFDNYGKVPVKELISE